MADDCISWLNNGAQYGPYGGVDVNWGLGIGGAKPQKQKPGHEYIAGGNGAFAYIPPQIPRVLSTAVDDVATRFGPGIYDAMYNSDPIVRGHVNAYCHAVLAGDIELLPAIRPRPGVAKTPLGNPVAATDKSAAPTTPASGANVLASVVDAPTNGKPKPAPPTNGQPAAPAQPLISPEPKPPLDPDYLEAVEIRDMCMRQLDRTQTATKTWMFQLLSGALVGGHKLAEIKREIGIEGDDKDKECLADVKVKPRWSWRFVVDSFMNQDGVLAFNAETMQYIVLGEEAYCVLTWQPQDNDPRGHSQLRSVYKAWNIKQALWPEYWQFLYHFSSPWVIGKTGPDEVDTADLDPQTGESSTTGPLISPERRMASTLARMRNSAYAVLAPGSELTIEWPEGDGETFLKAIDFLDRQIAFGILYTIRATMESKFGSRADSGTAQDQVGLLVRYGSDLLETMVEDDILHPLVEARYGKEKADRLTPKVKVGKTEHQDFASYVHAIANLMTSGYLTESQLPEVDALVGLPIRGVDDKPLMYEQNASPERQAQAKINAAGQITQENNGVPKPSTNGKPKQEAVHA